MPSSWASAKASATSTIWRVSVRAEVDGGADGRRAHVVGCFDRAEQNLVELVGVGEQLVVVDLHEERDLVGVLAGDRAEHAEGGGDGVAAALDARA